MKTVAEIILHDIRVNNPSYTEEALKKVLKFYLDSGAVFVKKGDTIFIVHNIKDKTAYYHTINADSINNFLKNLKTFFEYLAENNLEKAVTYFNNPKLKVLYKNKDHVLDSEYGMWKYKGVSDLEEYKNGLG